MIFTNRSLPWDKTSHSRELLLTREWLVTNGLGGFASGTISGAITRRYHGLLIAALPAPHGFYCTARTRFTSFTGFSPAATVLAWS